MNVSYRTLVRGLWKYACSQVILNFYDNRSQSYRRGGVTISQSANVGEIQRHFRERVWKIQIFSYHSRTNDPSKWWFEFDFFFLSNVFLFLFLGFYQDVQLLNKHLKSILISKSGSMVAHLTSTSFQISPSTLRISSLMSIRILNQVRFYLFHLFQRQIFFYALSK